jgi:hypothetical protein
VSVITSSTFKLVSATTNTANLLFISSILTHIGYGLPVITPTEPFKLSYATAVSMLENDDCATIYNYLKSSDSIDFFDQVKIIKTTTGFFFLYIILCFDYYPRTRCK